MPSEFLLKFRLPIIILLFGLLIISFGILLYKSEGYLSNTKVEVLEASGSGETANDQLIIVEIAGEVINPGVYRMSTDSRIDDLIKISGGFSKKFDEAWVDKYLNRASKLTDGQKIYIPHLGELSANKSGLDQNDSGQIFGVSANLININSASMSELDKLPGIGPTYAQKIIDQRNYSSIEELVSKGVLSKSLFEKIKDKIATY